MSYSITPTVIRPTTPSDIDNFLCELCSRERRDDEQEYNYFEGDPSRRPVTTCTTAAVLVAHEFNGSVFGYQVEDIKKIGGNCGGHDFALVGKYLVDWWAQEVDESGKAIYDLSDPSDAALVAQLYLPRNDWKSVPI